MVGSARVKMKIEIGDNLRDAICMVFNPINVIVFGGIGLYCFIAIIIFISK